jgi:hypothetical protein
LPELEMVDEIFGVTYSVNGSNVHNYRLVPEYTSFAGAGAQEYWLAMERWDDRETPVLYSGIALYSMPHRPSEVPFLH